MVINKQNQLDIGSSNAHPLPVNGNQAANLLPDYDMANRFLDALTGRCDEAVSYQFFDDKKKKKYLAQWQHLNRNRANLAALLKKQKQGCGVYVMVNKGDGKGRSVANVIAVRALFIDLDGSPWEPAADLLKPHLRVESSPGRFHLYWLVSDCSLEQFKPLQQAIAKKFAGDNSCVDLCRVLRVPGFYHLKTATPFLIQIIEENDLPIYTTQQIKVGLGLAEPALSTPLPRKQLPLAQRPGNNGFNYAAPKSDKVDTLHIWAAQNPGFDIIAAISPIIAVGKIRDGKQHIVCPFSHEHTDSSPDLSTFVVNAAPPQHKAFDIHCMHSHCAGRDRLSFLRAMLEQGLLHIDSLQVRVLAKKTPAKIYFPVKEIAAALDWSTLTADEYRIALHLTSLAWAGDGSLPADDWMLARRLYISEAQWQEYRATLTRTGWLIEEATPVNQQHS